MIPPRAPRSPARGRLVIAVSLAGFVLVASAVIWRRAYGLRQGLALQQLNRQRLGLEAQRTTLEREIRELTTRERLGAAAERSLGMRVPADSQVIVLPAPGNPPSGSPAGPANVRAAP